MPKLEFRKTWKVKEKLANRPRWTGVGELVFRYQMRVFDGEGEMKKKSAGKREYVKSRCHFSAPETRQRGGRESEKERELWELTWIAFIDNAHIQYDGNAFTQPDPVLDRFRSMGKDP